MTKASNCRLSYYSLLATGCWCVSWAATGLILGSRYWAIWFCLAIGLNNVVLWLIGSKRHASNMKFWRSYDERQRNLKECDRLIAEGVRLLELRNRIRCQCNHERLEDNSVDGSEQDGHQP